MGMFDDLFSSSRGPGVIGTLIALVILVGFGSLYMFVFDEGLQGGEKSIQSIIRDQESQIAGLKAGIKANEDSITHSKERQKLTEDVVSLERQLKLRVERITELTSQKQAAEKLITDTSAAWEQYKTQYRTAERARAVGEKLPELVTKSGKTYKNVTITKFDDRRMSIMSDTGSNGIEWTDLPSELVDRFQFTKELAHAKVNEENKITAEMTTAAKIFALKESLGLKQTRMQEEADKFQTKSADVSLARNRITQNENEINRLRGNISAEANKKGVRKIPFYEAQIRELNAKNNAEQTKIKNYITEEQAYQTSRSQLEAEISKITEEIRALEQKK